MTTARSSRSTASSRSKQQRSRQTKTTTQSSTPRQERTSPSRRRQSHGTTVNLPFVTAEFHRPDVRLPSGKDVAAAAESVRAQLPSREQTLFYGALTVGTVFAVIEWPVALAIGVGSALASHESSKHESSSE